MTLSKEESLGLRTLLARRHDGQLTPEEASWLKRLLAENQEARRLYAGYSALYALLELEVAAFPPEDQAVLPPALGPGFLGSAWHGAVGYFSSGWPVAYLIATVIFGLGLVVGALVPMSQPVQVARQSSPPSRLDAEPKMEPVVGRITGMVDCQWEEGAGFRIQGSGAGNLQSLIPNPQSLVFFGDKFALASGLMEITYDTGAKVILQGPMTYEVESAAGGFLSVGKLTARVENAKQQAAISKSPNLQISKLFVVKTPTATVTDLGTEFGVEVSETGITGAQVFSGKVKVVGRGQAGGIPEQTLLEGQAVQLTPGTAVANIFAATQQRFVRKIPAPTRELIAQIDYSETWTANSPTRAGSRLLLNDPESLRVEQCHGNPPRSWVFCAETVMTTWPGDNSPVPWPGHKAPGSKSGFSETICTWDGYFGFEYGLRDDFVVQFDAVQTDDRINITIGDKPATIGAPQSLSVFFHAPGIHAPEIGVFAVPQGEADTGLRSGIAAPWQWHNYAVRFNLREKRLTVWVDRQCRGMIDLAGITQGRTPADTRSWAGLPLTNRYVTIGGYSPKGATRVWTDNFRIGSARETEQ